MSYLQRAGEWFAFCTTSGRYCRRVTLYDDMEWGIDVPFEDAVDIQPAPLGGPVAVAIKGEEHVTVYSNAGKLLKTYPIAPENGVVIKVGWTREEHLVVVTNKYHVLVWELATLPTGAAQTLSPAHVIKLDNTKSGPPAKLEIFPGGLISVDVNGMMRSILFEERREPEEVEPINLQDYLTATPSSIEFFPRELNEDSESLVFVAPGEEDDTFGSVFVVNLTTNDVKDLDLDIPSGVAIMKLRHDGEQLALYTFSGKIMVVSTDFTETFFSFTIGASVPPLSMHWCGEDFMYATFSKAQVDDMEDPSHFSILVPCLSNMEVKHEVIHWDADAAGITATVAEVDGVRVITEVGCYLIENTPKCLARLFQLKSTAPTALVADAYQDYLNDDVRGIVAMRKIAHSCGADFADVVDELVDAACSEFELEQQEQILAVASFAKSFCGGYDADRYVEAMKRLRVLNAIRIPSCAVTMTLRQYQTLSGVDQLRHLSPSEAQVLVDRLVNRHEFQLAYDISTLLKMRVEKVLVRWSCVKVQQPLSDTEICASVAKVLQQCPGASFTDAALTAHRSNRQQLAIKLLNDEPRSQNKVMLFMQMQQDDYALRMALDSHDPDLIHLVLVKLMHQLSPQGCANTFMRVPDAQHLLAHASTVCGTWKRSVRLLLEDSHQTHVTARLKLEAMLRHEDAFFLDNLMEEKRPSLELLMVDENDTSQSPHRVDFDDDGEEHPPSDPPSDEDADAVLVETPAENDDADKDGDGKKKKKSLWSKLKKKKASMFDVVVEATKKKKEEDEKIAAEKSKKLPTYNIDQITALLDGNDNDTGGPSMETDFVTLPRQEPIQGTHSIDSSDLIGVGNLFSESTKPGADNSSRWCKIHMDLIHDQERLMDLTDDAAFLNASIVETIRLCFKYDMEKQAESIRTKYNVIEKKFWYTKLVALCEAKNWDMVDKLGGCGRYSKVKSPIGFLPFIETLAKHGREEQAAAFVPRLPDVYDRVEWYVKLDNFQRAIDDAYDDENPDLIAQIRKRASNPSIIEYATKRIKALD